MYFQIKEYLEFSSLILFNLFFLFALVLVIILAIIALKTKTKVNYILDNARDISENARDLSYEAVDSLKNAKMKSSVAFKCFEFVKKWFL